MDEIRIGVFICHCGSNIGGIIDCPKLTEYAKSLPHVVFTQDNLYTCSETGLNQIKKGIEENQLNRVVVAACTPRTHEPLFRGVCEDSGLNQYYFEFVNIREQDTWVHQKQKEKAYFKAEDLLRMGVARAALLHSLDPIQIDVIQSTLIVGGGIAGMSAAMCLANQGYKVHLIEQTAQLGGLLQNYHRIYPNDADPNIFLSIIEEIRSHPNITVYTSVSIQKLGGYVGNFEITIEQNGELIDLEIGTIILATGAKVLQPHGLFNYDGQKNITQLELETLFKTNQFNAKNIVMIQCVGSRNEERPYCSNICCMTALKNAKYIKETNPDANITILYRDIHCSHTYQEELYREVRKLGVIFTRYMPENLPKVTDEGVVYYNRSLQADIDIPADLVVLTTPLIARSESKELSQMLKVPIDENGFFLEAHVKLRPIDFSNDGIFVCGSCKWPTNISEAIAQGLGAAARVSRIISKDQVTVEGAVSEIDQEKCISCEICIKVCPYKAIFKNDEQKVLVQKVLCKGCGVCSSTCPQLAIEMHHFTSDQVFSQISALMERDKIGI
jgi:heterodisulfide reductase subunit A